MDSISDSLTQENIPCLSIRVYHPGDKEEDVFSFITFNEPQTYEAYEIVTFGRKNTCNFQLKHERASRLQFQLEALVGANCSDLQFEIKNLSNRFALYINGNKLSYLQKQLLPCQSVVQFTEFQFFLEHAGGDSVSKFQVVIQKGTPLPHLNMDARYPRSEAHFSKCQHDPREPIEVDEDLNQYMLS